MDATGWRVRGAWPRLPARAAVLGVCVLFVVLAVARSDRQLMDSDWTAFATGAAVAAGPYPGLLYDRAAQQQAQDALTGGGSFGVKGQGRLLPFLSPPWVALLAIPFSAAGFGWAGRLFILFGLAALLGGVALAAPANRWAPVAVMASFPSLAMLLNAQLDGLVLLGLGAAVAAERSGRETLAGVALGLTLVKPHLVIPVGAAMLLRRRWRLLGGWALAGLGLVALVSVRQADLTWRWLQATGPTVGRYGREVDPGTWPWLLDLPVRPASLLTLAICFAALALVLAVAAVNRRVSWPALIAGGVLVAPHAHPSDLVLVGLAIAVRGGAGVVDWALFSALALAAAMTPDPWPSLIASALVGSLLLRMARATGTGPAPGELDHAPLDQQVEEDVDRFA